MKSVCTIIVTWNRLEMLRACVASVKRNASNSDILVVDNASTDGTDEWLAQEGDVNVLSLPENTGGAGGFAAGMEWAIGHGYEWMWIMDDDVVAIGNPMEVISQNSSRADVIQAAKYEADGDECVFEGIVDPKTMRRRRIRTSDVPACGFVPCNVATFEGLFVSRRAVETIGYPDASFFYGLDDLFYGCRAAEKLRFVFVPQFVLKKQIDKSRASFRGKRFYSSTPQSRYYHVRNYWKVMRYLRTSGAGSWRMYLMYAYETFKAIVITMFVEWDMKGMALVGKGIVDGVKGRGGKA